LRHICVFSPPVCLEVPDGLNVASTAYGKVLLPSSFDGTRDLPSFNAVKICLRNKPKSSSDRQKKNKDYF
jgi:hypothetical protein